MPDPGAHVQEYGIERESRSVLPPSPGGESANDDDALWVMDRVNHRVVQGWSCASLTARPCVRGKLVVLFGSRKPFLAGGYD